LLGPVEIALLGGAALLLFGPEQFPKVARRAGSIVRDVQATSQQFIREMGRAADIGETHAAHEDLISEGSGAGPSAASAAASNGAGATVAHGTSDDPFAHDHVDLPGFGRTLDDDGVWGYDPPVLAFEEAGPLGFGSAIDPSATLILTGDGDVRYSVSLAVVASASVGEVPGDEPPPESLGHEPTEPPGHEPPRPSEALAGA
jgi:Sec-independent protein translocase protein TatA